jgi:hypothetical protein
MCRLKRTERERAAGKNGASVAKPPTSFTYIDTCVPFCETPTVCAPNSEESTTRNNHISIPRIGALAKPKTSSRLE